MTRPPLIHIQRDKPVTGYKALLHTLHSPRLSNLTWDQKIIERNYSPGRFGLHTTLNCLDTAHGRTERWRIEMLFVFYIRDSSLSHWRRGWWASGPVVSGSPPPRSSANSSLITVTHVSTLVIFTPSSAQHRPGNNPFDSRNYTIRYVECWVQSHTSKVSGCHSFGQTDIVIIYQLETMLTHHPDHKNMQH